MDWTALFIGISTGLLGLLSVYRIWEKSRFVLDQIGENGRGALLFNTLLSQFRKNLSRSFEMTSVVITMQSCAVTTQDHKINEMEPQRTVLWRLPWGNF